jgi:putative ABC transport system permease protein
MIRHYLASALATIGRAPVTMAAMVLTLALGLAAMMAVTGVVSYWRSSDSQLAPPGQQVVMFTRSSSRAGEGNEFDRPAPTTQPFLAKYIREDVPEFEAVARLRRVGQVPVKAGDRTVILSGANADPEFLDIFKLRFIAGDPAAALKREDGVIISQNAAERLFGNSQALGRGLILGGRRTVIVTGVFGPIPEPSQFVVPQFGGAIEYFSAMPPDTPGPERWTSFSLMTYGLLPAAGAPNHAEIDRRLAGLVERRMPKDLQNQYRLKLSTERTDRFTELLLDSVLFGDSNSTISVVSVFFGLGLVVLAIAFVNYANLAAALTLSSMGVIGMRRILGASRMGILMQSWIEASLMTLMALAVAATLLWLATPILSAQAGIDLFGALTRNPGALAMIASVAGGVALVAGLYPAFVASRARPVEALQAGRKHASPQGLSALLVGLQFASASTLLICVIVVGQQNAHMRSLALHRDSDPIVVMPRTVSSGVSVETLRQQLAGYPQIRAVGEVKFQPWDGSGNSTALSTSPGAPRGPSVSVLGVGFGYFDVYDQPVLAGRVFYPSRDQDDPRLQPDDAARSSAPLHVVIDRAYAEQLGFASPQAALGKLLYYSRTDAPGISIPRYEIIGVVETRAYSIQTNTDGGTLYDLLPNAPDNTPLIRIAANEVDRAMAVISGVWKELATEGAPGYRFEDEMFEQSFQAYERVGQLFLALSVLAFLISSTGLLGMALHVIQRRMHEIGVRKILGSSGRSVIGLLLADFSQPVLVANLLAWPLAYVAAQAYLSIFAHRIDLSPLPFLLSMLVTLLIAWAAVIGVVLKAASVRPAEVLRHA